MKEPNFSAGVQALIDKLREEGIAEGRGEAEKLVDNAHKQAKAIIDKANEEAERLINQAKKQARHYRDSAQEALQLAARDTILDMKSTLTHQFARRISSLVTEQLSDEDFLRKVILEIAGTVRKQVEGKQQEILLPKDIVGLDELRRHPEKVKEGGLGQFVIYVSQDMLREGVSIREGAERKAGLSIRLVEDDVRVDLNEDAIRELLLEHLLPRFRALLEGSIQ